MSEQEVKLVPESIELNGVKYIRADSIPAPEIIKTDVDEKQYTLIDAANVMAMGKVQNIGDIPDNKPLHLLMDFPIKNNVSALTPLPEDDWFEVYHKNEKWGRYSLEYLQKAEKLIKAWSGYEVQFALQENKNSPILIYGEDFGFVLAPRINDD